MSASAWSPAQVAEGAEAPRGLRRLAVRGLELVRHLARHPSEVRYVPAWLRLRSTSPMDVALPWLPFALVTQLEAKLADGGTVFEYGGGGSTKWFLTTGADKVVTVEHDPAWSSVIARHVTSDRHELVSVDLADRDGLTYVETICALPDASLDVVVVDGRERVRCAEAAAAKLKPGGLLVFDDINRTRYHSIFTTLSTWPTRRVDGFCPGKLQLGHVAVLEKPGS